MFFFIYSDVLFGTVSFTLLISILCCNPKQINQKIGNIYFILPKYRFIFVPLNAQRYSKRQTTYQQVKKLFWRQGSLQNQRYRWFLSKS